MNKKLFCLALLCALASATHAQQTSNPFLSGRNANAYFPAAARELFPILELYSAGVCEQYAGACNALVEDFAFFDKNPAASSLIYSGPFIGVSHRNYIIEDTLQSVGFAHVIDQVGIGMLLRYSHSVVNSYDPAGKAERVFSPSEVLFGLNASYNLFRSGVIDGISVGLNAKGMLDIFPGATDFETNRAALLFDIGALINMHAGKLIDFARPNLSAGLSYRNLGFIHSGDAQQPAGGELVLGLSYAPIPHLRISTDGNLSVTTLVGGTFLDALGFSVGLGVFPVEFLELSGGFHITSTQYFFTAGVSVTVLGAHIRFIQRFDLFNDFTALDNFSISVSLKTQETIAPNRQLSIHKLYLQGLQAFLSQDYETALELANQARLISPNYSPVLELIKQINALLQVEELL